jgi:hypothetical protein
MESLIRGYAIWGERHYSPQRSALARTHLDGCTSCRHTAWLIRHQQEYLPDPAEQAVSAPQPAVARQQRRLAGARFARRHAHGARQTQRVLS